MCMIALPILAQLWRRSQLAGLPDVGNPFDVAARRRPRSSPRRPQCFRPVSASGRAVPRHEQGLERIFSRANFRWSTADAALAAGSPSTRRRSHCCEQGSERPEAYLELPATSDGRARSPDEAGGHQRLSWIGDAALFEAGRLRAEGDPAGAWALLKAVVRASRDMQRAMPTAWCRTRRSRWSSTPSGRSPSGRRTHRSASRPATGSRRSGRRRGAHAAPVALLPGRISGRRRVAGVPDSRR